MDSRKNRYGNDEGDSELRKFEDHLSQSLDTEKQKYSQTTSSTNEDGEVSTSKDYLSSGKLVSFRRRNGYCETQRILAGGEAITELFFSTTTIKNPDGSVMILHPDCTREIVNIDTYNERNSVTFASEQQDNGDNEPNLKTGLQEQQPTGSSNVNSDTNLWNIIKKMLEL